MFDRDALRDALAALRDDTGSRSALDELTDLGAVHYEVLEMLSEMIVELSEAGYSKSDIRHALSEEVVLARHTGSRTIH